MISVRGWFHGLKIIGEALGLYQVKFGYSPRFHTQQERLHLILHRQARRASSPEERKRYAAPNCHQMRQHQLLLIPAITACSITASSIPRIPIGFPASCSDFAQASSARVR